ncbi:MAG TPA: hypothetical protein VK928_11255 [Longimicrobiales bacterium]|nr:hypothetical protein [Longimicrobiales bacterium]
MTIVLSVLGFAALFALFALVRPASRCDHNCGGCTKACPALQEGDTWKA